MATRRRSRFARNKTGRPKPGSKLAKAMRIVGSMTGRGLQRATTLRSAVTRAGISVRTYRTARKKLRTVAVRNSQRGGRRGGGQWYAKKR